MEQKCRIPIRYFVTSGAGQSDANTGSDHYETTAYDIALLDAGIENSNIMMYTNTLPLEAHEITIQQAKDMDLLHPGAVMAVVKAQMEGTKGEHLCAGVGRTWVYRQLPNGTEELVGRYVAEYEGYASKDRAAEILIKNLQGIVDRRYVLTDDYEYRMTPPEITTRDLVVDEEYGLVLVALCFVSYVVPEIA